MKTLSIDIETYSSNDLRTCGVYKYAQAQDFEILLFAYAYDDDPIQIVDLACKETLPSTVLSDLVDPDVLKTAYNANFERTCIAQHFALTLDPSQWECTMVKAGMLGLPMGLDAVSKALKLETKKNVAGSALIRFFSMPCKPTAKDPSTRKSPTLYADKWQAFKDYCVQDVAVEKGIRDAIAFFSIPEAEKELWSLDQVINDRGVKLDLAFITNAIRFDIDNRQSLVEEATKLTRLENPNSAAQLKAWLSKELGSDVGSLKKADIPVLLESSNCEIVDRVLNLRIELSKTSVKKYEAMQNAICGDDRVRGLLQFYGANRTGRWAGRLVQVQNLPQNHLSDLDLARNTVLDGDLELLQMLFGNVPDTLSQLIRTAFVVPQDHRFIIADFSAIEARVIAWLAGERWRMDVFASHGKIYEASAAQMFGVPIASVTKGSPLRQKGKVAELACIAKGEKVLTHLGLVNIENITSSHLLWDGFSFVPHGGLIYKGFKKVITYGGLKATADHVVWIKGSSTPVQFQYAATHHLSLLCTGDGGYPLRMGHNYKCRKKMGRRMERPQGFDQMQRLSRRTVAALSQFKKRKIKRLSAVLSAPKNTKVVRPKINRCKTAMYKSKRQELPKLWIAGDSIPFQYHFRSRTLGNRRIRSTRQKFRIRSNRQQWPLRKRESTLCPERNKPSKQEIIETFDIVNSGPYSRFTVSNVLVHNCGYGGGPGALITMGALKMGIEEDELPRLIKQWRNANRSIVQLWSDVENAAIEALDGAPSTIQHGVKFYTKKGMLVIQLPSGRCLYYQGAKLITGKFGSYAISYEGLNQTTKQWCKQDTYGGKLVENIIQAIARDCLAVAMLRLHKAGYKIAIHVHDEVVLEVPNDFGSQKEVNDIMSEPITWAKGLPLKADSYETIYYKKD